ncbi:MAG: pyrimidine-nucleoside phosphorylase, partial [Clostridia bacterium]|nr:pyrimidine-nucleoside phosphorylase [Clostridia bacterium]
LEKLAQMVGAQDGCADDVYDTSRLPEAPVKFEVISPSAGYVSRIEAEGVGLAAMHLGGGRATKESDIDLSVGVLLKKKLGDRVEKGESLATIHATSMEKAQQEAENLLACFELSDSEVRRPAFIKAIVR